MVGSTGGSNSTLVTVTGGVTGSISSSAGSDGEMCEDDDDDNSGSGSALPGTYPSSASKIRSNCSPLHDSKDGTC